MEASPSWSRRAHPAWKHRLVERNTVGPTWEVKRYSMFQVPRTGQLRVALFSDRESSKEVSSKLARHKWRAFESSYRSLYSSSASIYSQVCASSCITLLPSLKPNSDSAPLSCSGCLPRKSTRPVSRVAGRTDSHHPKPMTSAFHTSACRGNTEQ